MVTPTGHRFLDFDRELVYYTYPLPNWNRSSGEKESGVGDVPSATVATQRPEREERNK